MLAVRIQAAQAAALRDPEKRAKLVEHGHRQYRDYLSRDDVRARNRDPEIRKRAGQAITQTRLADILPEHRAEYQRLVRQKGLSAAEARAVIADMPGSELRAARRAIADFNNRQHARADREREQLY
ncbi:hypothetical protein [Sphingomonas sp.]|uniref:hypothetical protein n=1 Tax=Sphingomonas sp. TaxID=28214 RepID=UPI003AFF922B